MVLYAAGVPVINKRQEVAEARNKNGKMRLPGTRVSRKRM
jgi:glutathione synthase/RimK-type ligase-like ATP-grasp enzyme